MAAVPTRWGLLAAQSNGKASWWVRDSGSLNDSGSLAVPTNAWTYLTATWSASSKTASFYVNGVLNSTLHNTSIVEQAFRGRALDSARLEMEQNTASRGRWMKLRVSNAARSAGWIRDPNIIIRSRR